MRLSMDPANLNFFEALASQTRLEIIQLLAGRDMNIKELAEALDISSSIMTKHIRKLESARLISTTNVSKGGNRQKICTLLPIVAQIEAPFKEKRAKAKKSSHEASVPVGLFSALQTLPPCGMRGDKGDLSPVDEPAQMFVPSRSQAKLLWIGKGYVEYYLPNFLQPQQHLTDIEIRGEFRSEVTGYNDGQPAAIAVSLNGRPLCAFTTPAALETEDTAAGIQVLIHISTDGVYVNGEKKSPLTVSDFRSHTGAPWLLRFESSGRLTIYGKQNKNAQGGITLRTFYK